MIEEVLEYHSDDTVSLVFVDGHRARVSIDKVLLIKDMNGKINSHAVVMA